MSEAVRLSAWVHGQVQGVGFRWWTRARALELGRELLTLAAREKDLSMLVGAHRALGATLFFRGDFVAAR